MQNNGFGKNVNQISNNSAVDNTDESHLIATDTDEETASCWYVIVLLINSLDL